MTSRLAKCAMTVASLLTGIATANISRSCIEKTEQAGMWNEGVNKETGYPEDDLDNLHDIPLNDLAFARPNVLTVCTGNERVEGLQLTIKVHDEADFIKDVNDIAKIAEARFVDGNMGFLPDQVGMQYKMRLIGTATDSCEKIEIADDDKIVYIILQSDDQMLRRIEIELASGLHYELGHLSHDYLKKEHTNKMFTFEDKWDLLGMHGHIAPDSPGSSTEHIAGIGFYVNSCPIRDLLKWELEYMNKLTLGEEVEIFVSQEKAPLALVAIFIMLMIGVCTCSVVYIGRRKIRENEAKEKKAAGASTGGKSEVQMVEDNSRNISNLNAVPYAQDQADFLNMA